MKSKISEAENIAKLFPDGVKIVIGTRPGLMSYDTAVEILKEEHKIKKAQSDFIIEERERERQRAIQEKAARIRQECPKACEGKTDYYIVNKESLIREEEHKIKKDKAEQTFWYSAIKSQSDFLTETRELIKNCMPGWGRYFYKFKHQFTDYSGNSKEFSFYVMQAFCVRCCLDESVSYEFYPNLKNNRKCKTDLEQHLYLTKKDWEPIISLISEINEKYKDKLAVILVNTDCLSEKNYGSFVYAYIHNANKESGYNPFEALYIEENGEYYHYATKLCDDIFNKDGIQKTDRSILKATNKKVVIIDLITENANLINRCESLFNTLYDEKSEHEHTLCDTGIIYISILKCFDRPEVEELNKNALAITKAKNLAEKYPTAFNHYFPEQSVDDINAKQASSIIEKEPCILEYDAMIRRINSSISDWTMEIGVPHYFFYYYYPQRFDNISSESESARQLIYRFKNGIAHDKIKKIVVERIRKTFTAEDISHMTFVCIPASTPLANKFRYEEFAQEVSQELGMNNGYEHITIIKEKIPSRLGGTEDSEYSFDESFFKGKLILLFDDVVTRGRSMRLMKSNLESLGANVICAISIGRTYSDWNGQTRKPHPYIDKV